MAWQKATIVNCRSASIRQAPWIPLEDKEIVGIRDGPKQEQSSEITKGETIEIDPEDVCYSWVNRKYYKTRDPDGWIFEGVISFGGD